jgi:hypothetical protein
LDEIGTNCSAFVLRPAFKTYSDGATISSGDLLTISTRKTISGSTYTLHVSELDCQNSADADVRRQLNIDHAYIEGGLELNAVVVNLHGGNPSLFRMLQLRSHEVDSIKEVIRGEDVITFYHKQAGAYLHYEPMLNAKPFFYESARVSDKLRKKSYWLWKIENEQVYHGGDQVLIEEDANNKYRIKHVVTNMYLMQSDTQLLVTADYMDPKTLFSFRPFSKASSHSFLAAGDMAFVRGCTGDFLVLNDKSDHMLASQVSFKQETVGRSESSMESEEHQDMMRLKHRMRPVRMSNQELLPDSDALLVVPVRQSALDAVVSVRRHVLYLEDFKRELTKLPNCQGGNPVSLERSNKMYGSVGEKGVMEITMDVHGRVKRSLTRLVVNCTWGDELNPMSRDGERNK